MGCDDKLQKAHAQNNRGCACVHRLLLQVRQRLRLNQSQIESGNAQTTRSTLLHLSAARIEQRQHLQGQTQYHTPSTGCMPAHHAVHPSTSHVASQARFRRSRPKFVRQLQEDEGN
jgi:hypothetical protein